MGANYKDYKAGLNCKGFRSKSHDEANPKVSTERGKRRALREKKKHVHEWTVSKLDAGTSYHSARMANEARYYCKLSGCGATCRSPK